MSPQATTRRWAIRAGAAAFTATLLSFSLQYATAATTQTHSTPTPVSLINRMYSPADPYSPLHNHPYRHGVIPTRARLAKMRAWAIAHPSINPALNASALSFGGGVDGIGVTTGAPKVYLVFWGTQWGTQGSSGGNVTFSNDPSGAAPYIQNLFKGLGTGNELWSGVMTQYCQGVATGTQTCPAGNTQHVGYPTGGAYAGVWYDNSAAAPSAATQAQIGQEAVNASTHFGNTTAASNRNAQYDILSPHGTNPDNYQTGGFCAWHDWNGDLGVTSPNGDIALTNMPYVTDVGTSCGQNFVNSGSAGTDDGFSIVNGHEFAETVTDQNPAGGWTNSSGAENGDLCAWNQGGGATSGNLSLTTGTFAMQPTWGNDGANGGDCEFSHSIVGNGGGGNTVTVTNPGNQTGTVGTAASLQMSATDSQSGQTFTWSASGLPAGLSINSSSGLISGTPTTANTYSVSVTATDTTGANGSTSFTWTINSSGGCSGSGSQLLGNPGFETGSASPWSSTAGVINPNGAGETSHSGTWYAWLDGYGTTHTDTLSQSVTIPSGCTNTTFSFWLHIDTAETTTTTAFDTLKVQVLNSSGTVLATLHTFSNLDHISGYLQHTYSLGSYAGSTITLKFTGHEDISLQTSFVVDDTAVTTG
jgi:serine protease